jgi:hypothetical protein
MTIFSYRADELIDVMRFFRAVQRAEIAVTDVLLDVGFPADEHPWWDVAGEFCVPDCNLTVDTLLAAARNVDDIHILLETLRPVPLAQNSLERDYGLHAHQGLPPW